MEEYDLFIPLHYNDGPPVEPRKFRRLHKRLLDHFNGAVFFPQPNEGGWRMGEVAYRDRITIYRVLTSELRSARRFLERLKEDLKKEFRQEEILIVERDVRTL